MTKTAIAADDGDGGSARMTKRWDIERLEHLSRPIWIIFRSQGDEETALGWLDSLRRKYPHHQWRIKIVTTVITEQVMDQ